MLPIPGGIATGGSACRPTVPPSRPAKLGSVTPPTGAGAGVLAVPNPADCAGAAAATPDAVEWAGAPEPTDLPPCRPPWLLPPPGCTHLPAGSPCCAKAGALAIRIAPQIAPMITALERSRFITHPLYAQRTPLRNRCQWSTLIDGVPNLCCPNGEYKANTKRYVLQTKNLLASFGSFSFFSLSSLSFDSLVAPFLPSPPPRQYG